MCKGSSLDVLAVGKTKRGGAKVWVSVTEEGVQRPGVVDVHSFFCSNDRISNGLVFQDWWQKQVDAEKIPFFLNNRSSDFAGACNEFMRS